MAPVANPDRMRKSEVRQRDGVRRATTAEDASASSAMVPTTKDSERVGTAEAMRSESVRNPWRWPTYDDVILDVFVSRMTPRNYFLNFFLTAGRDIEESRLRLVKLIGRRDGELLRKLLVKSEVLTVDCTVTLGTDRHVRG
jgi:hypothetical protein